MNKKIIAATVVALTLPVAAFAAEGDAGFKDKSLSYTYGEFGYVDRTADFPGDPGTDGFGFAVSYEFTDLLFGFLNYEDLSGDFDYSTTNFGIGAAVGLTDTIDGYAKLGLVDVDVAGATDDGFGLEFGARSMVTEQVELFGALQYVDLTDAETGFEVGGRYWYKENLGFSLAYETFDDFNGFNLTARYEF
ncbi:MAG TPA: hypothetical protein VF254_03345 [Gammaproteobacteria bacterium]